MQMKIAGPVHPESILGSLVLDEVRELHGVKQLPSPLRDALLAEAVQAMHESDDPFSMEEATELDSEGQQDRRPTVSLIVPKWGRKNYFIVRDEDLALFDTVCSGLQAAAGAGFFVLNVSSSPEAVAAITAIVVSAFKLLRRLAQKGTTVDSATAQIILALRKKGPMPVAAITSWLQRTEEDEKWSNELVMATLESLTRVRLANGTVVPLVEQTPDGNWGVCNL